VTDEEYQKACEMAADDWCIEKGVYNKEHFAFQAGIAWANANPSPRVMRLIAGLKYYIDNCDACNFSGIDEAEFSARGCPSCDCLMAREALADFEDKP